MIAQLEGVLVDKAADRIVLNIHGVGYEVLIPFSTFYEMQDLGETVSLHIYTYVKEDTLTLYGFLTGEEKRLFVLLIQISGVGPKLGIAILSGLSIGEFIQAVSSGSVAHLSGVPGVGKKTAERLILETKDKIASLLPTHQPLRGGLSSLEADVASALLNLGYPKSLADKRVADAFREEKTQRFEVLLKNALRKMN